MVFSLVNISLTPTLITFSAYLIGMLAVGIYFMKKSTTLEDYLLGGRNMGSWVTALSTQASDMSGWLLMGLPGAVFSLGTNQAWIGIGLAIGTFFNWLLVAPRLRVYSELNSSFTISSFISKRFGDNKHIARIVSALIILFFFTIYAASGLISAGKLFESMLNINYKYAVIGGAAVLCIYTMLGGFLAVCWTDLFQGLLMFFAIIAVPLMAYFNLDANAISTAAAAKNISLSLFENTNGTQIAFLSVISSMAWGLGYFGMPHVITRFMSIKSHKELPKAMTIAMIWLFISMICAIVIGLLGMAMYKGGTNFDKEKVFIFMIRDLFNPWVGGFLLAAILAAIMSTTDSQLLVCSSALTEDVYLCAFNKKASDRELLWISRICVIAIALIATFIALGNNESILSLVANAWAGFGAAFGPVILMALFSKRTTWVSAFIGMVAGAATVFIWNFYELNDSLGVYELLPGFICSFALIIFIDFFFPQRDQKILTEFDNMLKIIKSDKKIDNAIPLPEENIPALTQD